MLFGFYICGVAQGKKKSLLELQEIVIVINNKDFFFYIKREGLCLLHLQMEVDEYSFVL